MGSDDLLRRQAAALARTTNARAEETKTACPATIGETKVRNEFRWIAAIAIEEEQNFGVSRTSAAIPAWMARPYPRAAQQDAGAGGGSAGGRPVPRGAVHDDDFAHALRKTAVTTWQSPLLRRGME